MESKLILCEPDCLEYYHGKITEDEAKSRLKSSSSKLCYLVYTDQKANVYQLLIYCYENFHTVYFKYLLSYYYADINKFKHISDLIDFYVKFISKNQIINPIPISITRNYCNDLNRPKLGVCIKNIENLVDSYLCEMTEGDLIQIQSELNQDWVWIKNFRSNKVGCASKIYLCPVSWMHQYPYYVDRITLDSFYEYFLQTEPGTFFIETKNSEMLNIYVKLLKKKYLVKDINVMDNTFKCDEQLFFSLRELTEYYSISPLQDNQSLIKSIEKERLAFPSIYFVFPLDSNMKIIPLLEKPIYIHSTKDILSHYFLYCLMDNKWEKYTYILDLYRRGLFLYPLNSAIIPDIIISLERFVIGAVHKSIVPSDFDNVFFIRDLDGIYSTYIYLCLENSEYSREFISLLESINNKNSCVLTKSYDMINSLKFNNELKRFVKTVQNIEIHLNCIELPSSVSMANFVNECVVCIDGVPVSKTRNVFVIKNKIIWDEKFSLNNTHIYECLEIHINKSPELCKNGLNNFSNKMSNKSF